MTYECRGACTLHAAPGRPSYATGSKYCTVCMLFIIYDGLRCPCCRQRLRTGPWRNPPAKRPAPARI